MKTYQNFYQKFQCLVVKFSIYLNRRVFVMIKKQIAPSGSIFFPFVADLYQKRVLHRIKQTGSHKNYLPF